MAQAVQETRTGRTLGAEILFVDDDAAQREMYRCRLEREGFRVRLADTADRAAMEVRECAPALVVLDIAMPGRDGLSALQELLDIAPAVPVIIHTAYPAFADNFLTWAADDYIEKSADLAPLLHAIERALVQSPSG